MDFKKRLSGHYVLRNNKSVRVLRMSDLKLPKRTLWQRFKDYLKGKLWR